MSQLSTEKIKSIVSIHRILLHAYLEQDIHAPVTKLKKSDAVPPETAPTYTIITDNKIKSKSGLAAVPQGISSAMYASVLKFEMCDFAVQALVVSLKKQLDLQVPGTKVDYITVDVKPLIKFRMKEGNKDGEPRHSLFLITVPESDKPVEIMADFTVEQFGYEEDCWFMSKEEYLGRVAVTREYSVCNIEEEIRQSNEEGWWETEEKDGMARLSKICESLDWNKVAEMATDARVKFLYKLYEYSGYLLAGQMSMEDLHRICLESHTDVEVVGIAYD